MLENKSVGQWTMSLPVPVEFGEGCLNKLGNHLKEYRRAILLTGKRAMKESGVTDRICGLLTEAGVEYRVYDGVSPDPDYIEIEEAAQIAKELGADVIIGCGGGSVLDAAKATAVAATHDGPILDYRAGGTREITSATLPVIAITATSGTGSHIGRAAVISDPERGLKFPIFSDYMYPTLAFCDPEILRTMPPNVTACTGFDAFAHALEGYLSTAENPMGNLCAREAIRIITQTLPKAYENGDDLELRAIMGWADTLAGVCLATNSIITPHAISLAIGKRYGIAHGAALASIMPSCLRHSAHGAIEKLADVARLMGCTEPLSESALADWTIDAVKRLAASVGLDKSIQAYGIPATDIDSIAEDVNTHYHFRTTCDPVPPDTAKLVEILKK